MASVLCFSCNDLSISVYTVSANSFLVRSVLWVMPDRVRPDNCDRAFKIHRVFKISFVTERLRFPL